MTTSVLGLRRDALLQNCSVPDQSLPKRWFDFGPGHSLVRPRKILVTAGAAILLALIAVGGILAEQALRPRISQDAATAAAVRQLQQMNPSVTGYRLVSARYDPAPDKIYDERGNLIGSESHSSCLIVAFRAPGWLCHAEAAWILHLRAPAQGGFSSKDAYVVVGATTGNVRSASLMSTN